MATVTVIFGGQEQGEHELNQGRHVVGRDPSCEIPIDNLGISRQHCAFENKGETFLVQDLGSSNGTYVNGRKVTEHYLNHLDEVVIGKYTLRFNNETQKSEAPQAADTGGVPDTMNTYVMDGAKIQEQLAKMRDGGDAEAKPGATPGSGATAKEIAASMEASGGDTSEQLKSIKNLLIASLVGNFILVVLLVLSLLGILKAGG